MTIYIDTLIFSLLFYPPIPLFIFLIILWYRNRKKIVNDSNLYSTINSEIRKRFVIELRLKSNRSKLVGYSALFVILMILGLGIAIFSSAGTIADNEINTSTQLTPDNSQDDFDKENATEFKSKQKEEMRLDYKRANQQLYALISSAIIRIGVSLIIFFVVQIFLRLYRYSLRMADFFDSRATALILGKDEELTINQFADLLNTDSITLDPLPKSPSQEVMDLLKMIKASK